MGSGSSGRSSGPLGSGSWGVIPDLPARTQFMRTKTPLWYSDVSSLQKTHRPTRNHLPKRLRLSSSPPVIGKPNRSSCHFDRPSDVTPVSALSNKPEIMRCDGTEPCWSSICNASDQEKERNDEHNNCSASVVTWRRAGGILVGVGRIPSTLHSLNSRIRAAPGVSANWKVGRQEGTGACK